MACWPLLLMGIRAGGPAFIKVGAVVRHLGGYLSGGMTRYVIMDDAGVLIGLGCLGE
jgi:hypothetical protein